MLLTLGVTILYLTTDIQIVLSSQCTLGVTLWSAKASMYVQITLFLFTNL